jgi:hypothetical protein
MQPRQLITLLQSGIKTYLIANISTNRYLHSNNLAVQPRMQHSPEIAKLALAAQQAREMHHFMLRRLVLAVSSFLVGVHCARRSREISLGSSR